MKQYKIYVELFDGLKKVYDIYSDHIERDIREIEEMQDSIGVPIMDIRYEKIG